MAHPTRFLLLSSSLGLLLAAAAAPTAAAAPGDERPQLVSTTGGGKKAKSLAELRALADKRDPDACYELGSRLVEGDHEVAADPAQARTLLERAADANHADALFRLGKLYHDGVGGPRDLPQAFALYTRAAKRGIPEAQHNVGAMLVSARGVKRDYVEGLAWLIVAEQSGALSDAVARTRERLKGRPKDIAAAERRAAELAAGIKDGDKAAAAPKAEVTQPAWARPTPPAVVPPPPPRPVVPVQITPVAPTINPVIPAKP